MKFIVRALPLLLSLLLLPGCGTQVQNTFKVQQNLAQAQYYAQLNNTTQARCWADRAAAVDPNALSTYLSTSAPGASDNALTIAQIFETSGDEPTLRDYMKQAAAKFPNDYRPLQILVDTYGLLGDMTDQRATATALAALLEKKLAAPGARDKALMLALAQAYCDAGNLPKGVADFQAIIKAFPSDPDAYNGLAYEWAVADSKPSLPQALADIQQALVLLPKQGWPDNKVAVSKLEYWDTLGWVQHQMGHDKDALSNIQSAINLYPRIAVERYHLGMVYEALHQPDAARAEFTHAILLAQGYAAPQQELSHLKETAPTSASDAPTDPLAALTAQR